MRSATAMDFLRISGLGIVVGAALALVASASAAPAGAEQRSLSVQGQESLKVALDESAPKPDRIKAAHRLAELKESGAVVPLAALLERAEGDLRHELLDALKSLGAVGVLSSDLGSSAAGTRRRAALLLGYLGDHSAVETLEKALRDPEATVREQVASALGHIGDPRAVPSLIACLSEDKAPDVRGAAAQALGAIGGKDAISALEKAQKSEADGFVQRLIKTSLESASKQKR
jgi:HEAT repeat protein